MTDKKITGAISDRIRIFPSDKSTIECKHVWKSFLLIKMIGRFIAKLDISSSTTVKRAIDHIGGPVTLVGHSYGGFVITNAGYNNPNVKGLVYVAVLAPREGQSLSTSQPPFPKEFEGKPLLIFDKAGFAYINPAIFHDFFVQDVDQAQAKVLAVVQKPANISGLVNVKSGPPAWKQLPTWYEVSEHG